MREKVSAIMFLVILVFVAVFCWQVFNKLFIQTSTQFSSAAIAAFFGAFLAFLFIRIGEFFKSYSERINKSHNALVKIEHLLNSLLGELDDNVYVIETFEELYKNNVKNQEQSRVFVWANRLTPVKVLDDLLIDLLNIDLINELFILNVRLRKLNDTIETINGAYKESKDLLISKTIDPANYKENLSRIRENLLKIKKFFFASISETQQAQSAIRVLAKNRPLMGYLMKRLPSHKYGRRFEAKRKNELKIMLREMDEIKKEGKSKIDAIFEDDRSDK
jgi:hypothetical protein